LILLKNPSESLNAIKTNGLEIEIVEKNPFMLSLSKHSEGFSAESATQV